ncbi:YidB family protein [Enterobacter ludwigii]|uniref:YidB family protein n=1 Tax=Enterobacter ludwigii TaxID=299767 RepID=UPI003BEF07AA
MSIFQALFSDNNTLRHVNMQALLQWVQEQGGLSGIEQKFQQSDLGHLTQGWLGQQDSPHAVEDHHLTQVFGNESIDNLANNLGIDAQTATSLLTTYLPKILVLLGKGDETTGLLANATDLLKSVFSRPS